MNMWLQISTHLHLILAETPESRFPPFRSSTSSLGTRFSSHGTVASLTWNFFQITWNLKITENLHFIYTCLFFNILWPSLSSPFQLIFYKPVFKEALTLKIYTHICTLSIANSLTKGKTISKPYMLFPPPNPPLPTCLYSTFLHDTLIGGFKLLSLWDINYIILHVCTLPSTRIVTACLCWQSYDTFCKRAEALEV